MFDMGNFCYIAKYWNSDRIKLLIENVRAIYPFKIWKIVFFFIFIKCNASKLCLKLDVGLNKIDEVILIDKCNYNTKL